MSLLETLKKQEEIETSIIKKYGGTNIEHYNLLSNDGYYFKLGAIGADARHWRNCYGAEVNYWAVHVTNYNVDDSDIIRAMRSIEKELNEVLNNG